jgi:hypothetical protein
MGVHSAARNPKRALNLIRLLHSTDNTRGNQDISPFHQTLGVNR